MRSSFVTVLADARKVRRPDAPSARERRHDGLRSVYERSGAAIAG
jgi:hypothetical protein